MDRVTVHKNVDKLSNARNVISLHCTYVHALFMVNNAFIARLSQADFTTYISQLTKIVRKICPGCDTTFCFACGEAITEKVKRPNAAQDDNPLFHCSNLQGVILGIGLSMTEHMFTEQVQDSESKDERTAKRRKTNSAVPIDMNDTEDEYSEQAPARRGTGYSGAAREDVCIMISCSAI